MKQRGQIDGGTNTEQMPELPKLASGIQLLDMEDDERATGPLHALVLDHVLLNEGTAVWVDAGGHAVTQSLASLSPSMRTLDRVQVARAFTAHQHYRLVRQLREQVSEDTSLIVCPALDRSYRETETYADEGDDLLLRALATIAGVADRHGIPVLVTRSKADSFSGPIATAAEETIRCERTKFGPRFVGADFETLVYPMESGMVQTTLAFWKRVLDARAPAYETMGTSTPEVTVDGAY